MLLCWGLLLVAPVECSYDKDIDKQADKQQQKEKYDQPGEGRHLDGLLGRFGFLDQA